MKPGNTPPLTHIIMVVDASESIRKQGLREAIIRAFNDRLLIQGQQPMRTHVTLILFNRQVRVICHAKPIEELGFLTYESYATGSGTALHDAVVKGMECGDAVSAKFDHTVLKVFTDGIENESKEYPDLTGAKVIREYVEERVGKGWITQFFGFGNRDTHERAAALLGFWPSVPTQTAEEISDAFADTPEDTSQ